jgi:hypothetical protein
VTAEFESVDIARSHARRHAILDHANDIAAERQQWIARNRAFYRDDRN